MVHTFVRLRIAYSTTRAGDERLNPNAMKILEMR
jgi:hypothetical protein